MPTEAHLLAGGEGRAVEARLRSVLAQGADPNAASPEDLLLTPLHVAASWGRLAQLHDLLRHGADPARTDDDGLTPRDLALRHHRHAAVQALDRWAQGQPSPSAADEALSDDASLDASRAFSTFQSPEERAAKSRVEKAFRALFRPCWSKASFSTDPSSTQHTLQPSSPPSRPSPPRPQAQPTPASQVPRPRAHEPPVPLPQPLLPPQPAATLPAPSSPAADATAASSQESFFDANESVEPSVLDETVVDEETLAALRRLSVAELRERLSSHGVAVGPVSRATRPLFEKRLAVLDAQPQPVVPASVPSSISRELAAVLGGDWSEVDDAEEGRVAAYFLDPSRAEEDWREGHARTAFTYLLLDPAGLHHLPLHSSSADEPSPEHFAAFVSAIFYVGKGKSSRPYAHLQDAKDLVEDESAEPPEPESKLGRILSVWSSGSGVVSLQVVPNSLAVEALSREAALIDALGLASLTNKRRGEFYGLTAAWEPRRRRRYGVALLRTAFRLLLLQGLALLRPHNVPPRFLFTSPRAKATPTSKAAPKATPKKSTPKSPKSK